MRNEVSFRHRATADRAPSDTEYRLVGMVDESHRYRWWDSLKLGAPYSFADPVPERSGR
jgi:hypothetical protein